MTQTSDETEFFDGIRTASPKLVLLSVVLLMQVVCVLFFLWDVYGDLQAEYLSLHLRFEMLAVLALIAGVTSGAVLMRNLLFRTASAETTLRQMRDTFGALVGNRFRDWELTKSEREVAWLTLKGFDIGEIAALRSTAKGTVRAQLSRIYEKSDTVSQGQFVSQFLDILLEHDETVAATVREAN